MKIVVCVRQSVSGEMNPFDACAYEAALRIEGGDVTLLSMGPPKTTDFLRKFTRLGAAKAYLLSDKAFAGADTLATAYTLSLAIQKIKPDLILCGRQTVDGDTGQVGPELAVLANYHLITNVMELRVSEQITCRTRMGEEIVTDYPALLTVERIHSLRLPSLRSKEGKVEVWDAAYLGADLSRCGLTGSPTKVLKTFENEQDRRKCRFISKEELPEVIHRALQRAKERTTLIDVQRENMSGVWIVGESPRSMAETISNDITVIALDTPERMANLITQGRPKVVLWGSDPQSKTVSAQVAALLQLGLCADCTVLETDGEQLFMYRPAFSGNIIAKIRSTTLPQMATVRTQDREQNSIIVGVGAGAKAFLEDVNKYADRLGAELVASRVMVDHDFLPYEKQVGLTGKSISPDVYVALGISGAVHHIAGIRQSGTIIAVNCDRSAEIFKYADYGIIDRLENVISQFDRINGLFGRLAL